MRALITGITGQDGAYLAKYLLGLGYDVCGVARRSSNPFRLWRLDRLGIADKIELVEGDVTDAACMSYLVDAVSPDEIYNLAAMSFVGVSWLQPSLTAKINGIGALNVLEAANQSNRGIRVYQASTSEMYGSSPAPQNESTPFHPRSPYGASKLFAHSIAVNYRESYDMHVSCGILFNHESPLRGEEFVTRKITMAAARIARGKQKELRLGNPSAVRDWGHAADYVRTMHTMINRENPGDYVVATGRGHTVFEFCMAAFRAADVSLEAVQWNCPEFGRPAELNVLCGDSSRARAELDWRPRYTFEDLVAEMTEEDMKSC